ncbi:exodeoxyribonuclease VII small subunit [uncultured Parolsenella sp.]|uniref:exodeoxyribonuclease VII small subunit n=1 Tax=uncultured Parolsenella sp. TaxID=2083008 RepID=UPI0027DDF067|nr:exodeoxyribonuclease VII small subunit [uncultured Parolsenella sp.]
MAKGPDTSGYQRFSDVTARLDEIIADVRNKDTSLERSLDLFDEAIALGTRAVDLVDKAAFSPEERERLAEPVSSEQDAEPEKSSDDSESSDASDSDPAANEAK